MDLNTDVNVKALNLKIRPYQPQDLASLMNAWETASALAHPFVDEVFLSSERRNIPELYLPNADTWVAVVDEKVVGFIALLAHEVGGLFLDPGFHGQGIGRAMMDKAQSLHGALELKVFKQNAIGRRFYEAYGFTQANELTCEQSGEAQLLLKFKP